MHLRPIAAALLLAGSLAPCALAQYTVKHLVFKGGEPYPNTQLEAVTGLKAGQHIGQAQMGTAAQNLMDTGAFGDVEVTLNGPVAGIDVVFKLKPADPATLLPVSFENIVWLSPEEREAGLLQAVPLYGSRLPAAGTLQTSVQAALQQMLTAKGVTATVELLQKPSTPQRPTNAIAYRVTQPRVTLAKVQLTGVTTELAAEERTAIQRMMGTPFNEGIDNHLADTLLGAYRDAGYLDAELQDIKRIPVDDGHGTVQVTINARVVAQQPYHVSAVQWSGSDLFSTDDFAKANKLHAGDPASASALKASYRPLLDAYLQHGFVDVSIDPQPVKNEAAHTVAYNLSVKPGAMYRVGAVHVQGLSAKAQQEFDSAWKLKPGSVFDAVYALNFLQLNTALRSLQPYTGKVDTVAHPETHTVDVTLTFFANNRG